MSNSLKSAIVICRGSVEEGWGHVMRGLTIRDFLQFKGLAAHLVVRLDKALSTALRSIDSGPYQVTSLDSQVLDVRSADLCFIDQYHYNVAEIAYYQSLSPRLIVFDELAKIDFMEAFRKYDIVIRAQLLKSPVLKSAENCKILNGLPYFVIKRKYPDDFDARKDDLWDVLVTLGGGAGHEDVYVQLAEAFAEVLASNQMKLHFVLGANASDESIAKLGRILPSADITGYAPDLIALMRRSRTAIVSGGYSKYEAAYTGTPTVVMAVQDHQIDIGDIFCKAGGGVYVGDGRDKKTPKDAVQKLLEILNNASLSDHMSEKAKELIDGQGLNRIFAESMRI